MALAIGIFAVALAAIATERVNRTKVAFIGAGLVVVLGVIDQQRAIESIDFNTIGLLAGMMLVVRVTEATGVYDYMAIRAAQLARGRSLAIVCALAVTTAVLSAFLDNLTTVLLMVPVTFVLAQELEIDPVPLVIIEILTSNIGGTATLIGDPPNILIAGATGLSFVDFVTNLGPIVVVTFVVVTGLLYRVYRSKLQVPEHARRRVMRLNPDEAIKDRAEMRRTVPVLLVTIGLFFIHKPLHLEPATVALCGAAVMLLVTTQTVERALEGIEWPTLFFFLGLFVMVGALEATGAVGKIADGIASATGGDRTAELLGITWVSAVASGAVDNIPFTATMIPVVEDLQGDASGDNAYWWALALGACFGGNATLIAAAANVAAAGLTEQHGRHISFLGFLKIGLPVTALTLLIATGYIALRYL
jgi:Na+/H+ antiporter NhaD/arsenite permease-like protein